MAQIETKEKEIGTVKIKYVEDMFALHEQLAQGTIEGHKFTVHHSWGSVYVEIDGLIGSIPHIGVDVGDLVQAAYGAAVEHGLLKKKKKAS